jgi:hypothetical protein
MKGESVEDLESGEDALLLGGSFLVMGFEDASRHAFALVTRYYTEWGLGWPTRPNFTPSHNSAHEVHAQ